MDNGRYFAFGGQIGLETKRGCHRQCLYCADPVAKGSFVRLRDVRHIADEAKALLVQGIDMLHLCDSEFNLPRDHALAVCREFIRQGLGERINWYAYLSVVPFDKELAKAMQRAGCVGIDFTTDSAHAEMLKAYGQPYGREEDFRSHFHPPVCHHFVTLMATPSGVVVGELPVSDVLPSADGE